MTDRVFISNAQSAAKVISIRAKRKSSKYSRIYLKTFNSNFAKVEAFFFLNNIKLYIYKSRPKRLFVCLILQRISRSLAKALSPSQTDSDKSVYHFKVYFAVKCSHSRFLNQAADHLQTDQYKPSRQVAVVC